MSFFCICLIKVSAIKYDTTPSKGIDPTSEWPAHSLISRSNGWSLVVALHPKCPCSRATVAELERLLANCDKKLNAVLLFDHPEQFGSEWVHSELWNYAAHIPQTTLIDDMNGRETDLFHATVSGETFLYDPHGRLAFHGGLTESRGHEGDNWEENAILQLVRGAKVPVHQGPIFGCTIK